MPCMPAHHFDYLYPAMRARRCARTLDYFGDVSEGRVETQRVIGAGQILVNSLRYPHDWHTQLGQAGGHAECVFATARHYGVKFEGGDVRKHLARAINMLPLLSGHPKRICARRTQIRASVPIPTPYRVAIKGQRVRQRIDETAPAIKQTNYMQPKF